MSKKPWRFDMMLAVVALITAWPARVLWLPGGMG